MLETRKKGYRMWKSGKKWLYAAGGMSLAFAGIVAPDASADEIQATDLATETPQAVAEGVVDTGYSELVAEVSAEVVETVEEVAVDTTVYETATNLEDLQPEATAEQVEDLANEGNQAGEIVQEIDSRTKDKAIETAKSEGVIVNEGEMETFDNLKDAQEENEAQKDRVVAATETKRDVDGIQEETESIAKAGNVTIITEAPKVYTDSNAAAVKDATDQKGRAQEAARAQNSIDESLPSAVQVAKDAGVNVVVESGVHYLSTADALTDLQKQLADLETATITQREIDSILAVALDNLRKAGVQVTIKSGTPTRDVEGALKSARALVTLMGEYEKAQIEADKRISDAELVAKASGVQINDNVTTVKVGTVAEAETKSKAIEKGLNDATTAANDSKAIIENAVANSGRVTVKFDGTDFVTAENAVAKASENAQLVETESKKDEAALKAHQESVAENRALEEASDKAIDTAVANAGDVVIKDGGIQEATKGNIESKTKDVTDSLGSAQAQYDSKVKAYGETKATSRSLEEQSDKAIENAKANAGNVTIKDGGTKKSTQQSIKSDTAAVVKALEDAQKDFDNKSATFEETKAENRKLEAQSDDKISSATNNAKDVKVTIADDYTYVTAGEIEGRTQAEADKITKAQSEYSQQANSSANETAANRATESEADRIVQNAVDNASNTDTIRDGGVKPVTRGNAKATAEADAKAIEDVDAFNKAQKEKATSADKANQDLTNAVVSANAELTAIAGTLTGEIKVKSLEELANILAETKAALGSLVNNNEAGENLKNVVNSANTELDGLISGVSQLARKGTKVINSESELQQFLNEYKTLIANVKKNISDTSSANASATTKASSLSSQVKSKAETQAKATAGLEYAIVKNDVVVNLTQEELAKYSTVEELLKAHPELIKVEKEAVAAVAGTEGTVSYVENEASKRQREEDIASFNEKNAAASSTLPTSNVNNVTPLTSSTNLKDVSTNGVRVVASGTLNKSNINSGDYSIHALVDEEGTIDESKVIEKIYWSRNDVPQAVDGGTYYSGRLINKELQGGASGLRDVYDMNPDGTTGVYGTIQNGKWYVLNNVVKLASGDFTNLYFKADATNTSSLYNYQGYTEIWNQNGAINAINGYGVLGAASTNGLTMTYRVGSLTDTSTKYLWTNIISDIDLGQYITNDSSSVVTVGGGILRDTKKGSWMGGTDLKGIDDAPEGTITTVEYTNTYSYTLQNNPATNSKSVARADFGVSITPELVGSVKKDRVETPGTPGTPSVKGTISYGTVTVDGKSVDLAEIPTLVYNFTPSQVAAPKFVAEETPVNPELKEAVKYTYVIEDPAEPEPKAVTVTKFRIKDPEAPIQAEVEVPHFRIDDPAAPEKPEVTVTKFRIKDPEEPVAPTVTLKNLVVTADTGKVVLDVTETAPVVEVVTRDIDMDVELHEVRIATNVHPVEVSQQPANVKGVYNEDGVNIDGKTIPKGSTIYFTLANEFLKAGRPVTTSYALDDNYPQGFEVDIERTVAENSVLESVTKDNVTYLQFNKDALEDLNLNLDQNVKVPTIKVYGKVVNDMATYENVFTTIVNGGRTGNVIVRYFDLETNVEIIPRAKDTEEGQVGSPYDTTDLRPEVIATENGDLYERVERVVGDENGSVVEGTLVVDYFYVKVDPKPNKGNVVVDYINEEGETIKATVVDEKDAPVGKGYNTTDNKPTTIITEDGIEYTLVPEKTIGEESGDVVEGTTKVTYVYKRVTPPREPGNGYQITSNKVVVRTPGYDNPEDPNDPNYDPNRPNDSKIEPEKVNYNAEGDVINGKEMLQGSTNHYVAEWDLDQYKDIVSPKEAIARGFAYVDVYQADALEPLTENFKAVTQEGEEVTGLTTYHVEAGNLEALPEEVVELLKGSGIYDKVIAENKNAFIFVADDAQAFFDTYVVTGSDIFFNLPMNVKEGFTGDYTNEAYQIDFGNGYKANIVENHVPDLVPTKDVIVDGESVDGQVIAYGQVFSYLLKGSVIPGNRGEAIWEYGFIDDYDQTGDKYMDNYTVTSTTDITIVRELTLANDATYSHDVTLADGTIIKAGEIIPAGTVLTIVEVIEKGSDLTEYTTIEHDEENGIIRIFFTEEFLAMVTLDSEFGADASLDFKRIAYGEFENTYINRVNGVDYISNTVKTSTPAPVIPETPAPVVPEAPAPAPEEPAVPALPNTGEASSVAVSALGVVLSMLGIAGVRRRKED